MKIGIVGLGVVGTACKNGFEKLGHKVYGHDIKLYTSINDVLDTEVCYICVPTPSNEDGSCDISIVEDIVSQLNNLDYNGIVAIKSTVEPGTNKTFRDKYKNIRLYFVPEFLRERCATDFSNSYKALRITFANSFYKLCEELGANYDLVKDSFLFHGVGEGHYLNVNKEFGGFGGTCLPKDTRGLAYLVDKLGLDLDIFRLIVNENEKFVVKVPEGMRKEI